jgi:hypothetical protein
MVEVHDRLEELSQDYETPHWLEPQHNVYKRNYPGKGHNLMSITTVKAILLMAAEALNNDPDFKPTMLGKQPKKRGRPPNK